ncbi:MAG: GlsB/YeaQ/YmgE family stress response membrane protein, partial [Oscillospiraceae bacterium]|nr:GlsB/YeaQ/YmgE family stress response membrane protein [Oscillospiraceae bacterium]
VGILGSFVGSFLFGLIGFHTTGIASFIVSVIGACICIALARKIN